LGRYYNRCRRLTTKFLADKRSWLSAFAAWAISGSHGIAVFLLNASEIESAANEI
jgi:hypothetical protein